MPLSLSIAHPNRLRDQHYADLPGTLALMQNLQRQDLVDGFEFQHLAEWDASAPPRDDGDKRLAAWQASEKYTVDALADALNAAGVNVTSVHANRDVGVCLCGETPADVARGELLFHDAMRLAAAVGAEVCVVHLWDTWKTEFNVGRLYEVYDAITSQYPTVKAAIENVPSHLSCCTPFELAESFRWITLDTRWAAMYDELDRFQAVQNQIANVHLQGILHDGRWAQHNDGHDFYAILEVIRSWGYDGLWTLETSGLHDAAWDDFVAALATVRG